MFARRKRWLTTLWMFPLMQIMVACTRSAPEYTVVEPQGEFLELDVGDESASFVRFYTYKSAGKNVNFFVRRDRNGDVRTHLDACFSCFKYKLGYVHEGNQVVCRACRFGYDLAEPIWDFIGPCAPITLSSKVLGNRIRIRRRDLEKGTEFF